VTPVVALLVAVGMLAVVPLGLPLLGTAGIDGLRRAWPWAGVVGAGSLLLPVGLPAVLLTLPYAGLCTIAAGLGLRRAWTARPARGTAALRELTALTALGSLPVAGSCLVAERGGYALLGFGPDLLALTVAHFHFAGFAVATLAGLVLVRCPGRLSRTGATAVPAGTALVAVGHLTGPAVELAGALLVAVGVLALSGATLGYALGHRRMPRALLVVAVAVTPVTMGLALWWAVGRWAGLPHLDLATTAATHGVANALGLCLCGLLGWRLLRATPV